MCYFLRFNSVPSKTSNVWCLPKISFLGEWQNCSQLGSTDLYHMRQEQFCWSMFLIYALIYALYACIHLLYTGIHKSLHSQSWWSQQEISLSGTIHRPLLIYDAIVANSDIWGTMHLRSVPHVCLSDLTEALKWATMPCSVHPYRNTIWNPTQRWSVVALTFWLVDSLEIQFHISRAVWNTVQYETNPKSLSSDYTCICCFGLQSSERK